MGVIVPIRRNTHVRQREVIIPQEKEFVEKTPPRQRSTAPRKGDLLYFHSQPEMKSYEIVDTIAKLKRLRNRMLQVEEFAFDTETNTLRVLGPNGSFKLVGISISWGFHNNYYIPVGHIREEDELNQLDLDLVVRYLRAPFEREDVRIIGHNLKFDMHVLSRIGIFIKTKDLFDTMIASWLCDENTPNGLKENTDKFLGIPQTHFKDVLETIPVEVKKKFGYKANSKVTFDLALIKDAAPYALADAFYTWQLYLGFLDLLEHEEMLKIYWKVYAPFIRTLYNMEERGVTVNLKRLDAMEKEIRADMDNLQYSMYEIAGVEFNPSSGPQLSELLFHYVKPPKPVKNVAKCTKKVQKMYYARDIEALENEGFTLIDGVLYKGAKSNENILAVSYKFKIVDETDSGAPSTSADTLWKLSRMSFKNKKKQEGVELCKLLMEYKKLDKLLSAFVVGLKEQLYEDGKAHPSFNIIGTDSGRLSCSEPNLQQLPKADEDRGDKYMIRSLFIGSIDEDTGKRNKIIAIDYSNLEVRVNAHFSEDENLLQMFATGADVHGSTAVNMFELDCEPNDCKKKYPHLRQVGKVLNFLLIYGGGAPTLYDKLKSDHDNPIDLGDKKYLEMYKCKNGIEVAQIYIDKYFSSYKGVAKFIRTQKKFAHRNGYVYTLLRRKRRLPNINGRDFKEAAYCERLAVNSPVQGSAADITMSAQNRVNLDSWFEEHGCLMILQVHDEIVFECPEEHVEEAITRARALMEHPFGDKVELNLALRADADWGDSYQEAK